MTTTTHSADSDAGIGGALWATAAIAAVAVVAGYFVGGPRVALGVGLGGVVAGANLWLIARVVRAFLSPGGSKAPWFALVLLKLTVLVGGAFLLLHTGVIDLMPLIVGYGALPLGIVLAQLRPAGPAGGES
jgi:hypothetical protein